MAELSVHFEKAAFNPVYYPYLDDQTRTQIYFGGSASGKSVFAASRVVKDLLQGGRNYLICRNVAKTIRGSIFTEITKYITQKNLSKLFNIHKTDLTITCVNDQQAVFVGLDDVEKIKSITVKKGVITDVLIEEATETDEDDIRHLEKRLRGEAAQPKRLTLVFNPILKTHWIYQRFFNGWRDDQTEYKSDNLLILKTTYKDNVRFLSLDDIVALEGETNEYFYNVYTLGNWGVLGDLVFTGWRVTDILNDPIYQTFDTFKNGLDFGFTNDPTALVRCHFNRALGKIYITHEYHNKGVTNPEIASDIKPIVGRDLVTCDSAEPKSIKEIQLCGIVAQGAVKGKDSIQHGVQWLQQFEIIIDRSCQHTINEFSLYQWDKKQTNKRTPVDRFNNHIDALRYALESEMGAQSGIMIAVGDTVSSQYEEAM